MAFWQSPEWLGRTNSIYPTDPEKGDPEFMPWWKEAWTMFRRSPSFDIVLTMGIRESFAYASLCWLSGRPSRQIMTEIFIDAPQDERLAWKFKTFLYRKLARRCIGIITNSTAEIDTNARRFHLPRDRFRYVPLNTTISSPEYIPAPDGYLFCAGRTLRDYTTLMTVMREMDLPWRIVAGKADMAGMAPSGHVEIYREIERARYLDVLRGARIVVLPLLPTERSTGQVVLLEAMSYGKPVITTRTPGTEDIVRHGRNGFLVAPGDAGEIIRILKSLTGNQAECERVGKHALEDILSHHATRQHALERIAAVEDLYNQSLKPTGKS